jgi:hypothetical protein
MFERFSFSKKQIEQYLKSAERDLKIALEAKEPEVLFRFAYDALLKLAITLSAENNLRVKAKAGHHQELIEKLATILHNEDISLIGNDMRKKRNAELYNGGNEVSSKEAKEYLAWVKNIFTSALGRKASTK